MINGDDFSNVQTQLDKHENDLSALKQNHCDGSPCKNGAKCLSGTSGFTCQCKDGWTGTTCTEDVNECADYKVSSLICQNGAQCVNEKPPTRFTCNCTPEYSGESCQSRYNDCHPNPCGKTGTCVDLERTKHGEKAFECNCFPGYELSEVKVFIWKTVFFHL